MQSPSPELAPSPALPPERYQPPLGLWSHLWRYALCLVISGLAWSSVVEGQWHDVRTLFWLDIALGAVAYPLVAFRRRWPLPVAVLLNLLAAFSGIAAGPACLATVSLASRRVFWQVVVLGLVSLSAGEVFTGVQPTNDPEAAWVDLTVNLVATVALLGWGMFIGSRRELLWTLRDQVEKAQQERDLRAFQARSSERARIAREMHDVLAHRISQVSMHANAVMFREDLTADQMRESVAVIQEKANEALTDLRSVLGVLRDQETGQLLDKPQPTYADLPELVEDACASGMHVEYVDLVAAGGTSILELTGRTVFRIVQEGLTNARKHAPGALVSIRLSGSESEGLDVLVRNPLGFGPPAAPPSGLGLVGLRERAELRGGRLDAGPDGSTWVLHGWIPWEA
jgi:signal transduction histidine kinase